MNEVTNSPTPRSMRWWRLFRAAPLSLIVCLLFGWEAWHEVDYYGRWRDGRMWAWDIEAYHHYLPATIIHGDVGDLSYVARLDSSLGHSGAMMNYSIGFEEKTGKWSSKYTGGTALFELPGFLIAHAIVLLSGTSIPADGYSWPYALAWCLTTIAWVVTGLLVLRRFLLRYCTDIATAAALIVIAFGTNLWCYTTLDVGMSHPPLFALFCIIIDATDRWHRSPRLRTAVVLGAAVGWAVLARPIDGMVILVPVLWSCVPRSAWRAKWKQVGAHPWHVVGAAVAGTLFLVPQLLYWKYTTDQFFYNSYGGEQIHLAEPHLWEGWFSIRKGWFVYSPLITLGFVGLFIMLAKAMHRAYAVAALVTIVLMSYVIFCWWMWFYGGGFGSRATIPLLALLALPTALLVDLSRKHKWSSILMVLVIYAGVTLNQFQTRQYYRTLIHYSDMTWERYRIVWGEKFWHDLTEEDKRRYEEAGL